MSADSGPEGVAAGSVPPGEVTAAAADAGLAGYVGTEASARAAPTVAFFGVLLFLVGVLVGATNRAGVGLGVGVGVVLAGVALGVVAVRMVDRPRHAVYCYEGGIVSWSARHGVAAYPWSRLRVYEWVEHGSTQSRSYRAIRVDLRTDQDVLLGRYGGDPERGSESVARADRIAAMVTAPELDRATASLAAGDAVVYGPFRLTRDAVTVDGVTLPWSQVRAITPSDGHVSVYVHGRKAAAVRVRRRATPQPRALLALADARVAAAAPDG